MKILLIALVLVTLLSSDEMQRIQNIVDDITQLRVEHENCKKQLNSGLKGSGSFEALAVRDDEKLQKYEMHLKNEKQRNEILLVEIGILTKDKQSILDLKNKLEKKINQQEVSLKSKKNRIKNLKNKIKVFKRKSLKKSLNVPAQTNIVCEKKNSFPKLIMKEGFESPVNEIQETYRFKASTFRLKNDASIYNTNGDKMYVWKKNTSFTSNKKSEKWIKVTGYFIDKKWLASKEDLWVKSEYVIRR